jgi:hypothetical protein
MDYYKFSSSLLKSLIVIWLVVLALALQLVCEYYFTSGVYSLLAFILGLVIGTVSGAYFYVILSIPYLLMKEFDAIKNKVALDEYNSVDAFQIEVANFLLKFFRFPGMSITGGKFSFKGCQTIDITSKADYTNIDTELDSVKIIKDKKCSIIALPINVGEKHLGDIYLETNTIFLRLLKNILVDFENYLLDDLLMIVILLNKKK